MAYIQPSSALCFPCLQQWNSLAVVDTRSKVRRINFYSLAAISINSLRFDLNFTDIYSLAWQRDQSLYSTSTSTAGITSTSNAIEHPRATNFNHTDPSLLESNIEKKTEKFIAKSIVRKVERLRGCEWKCQCSGSKKRISRRDS